MEHIEHNGAVVEVPTLITTGGGPAVEAYLAADADGRLAQLTAAQLAEQLRRQVVADALKADPSLDPVSGLVTVVAVKDPPQLWVSGTPQPTPPVSPTPPEER